MRCQANLVDSHNVIPKGAPGLTHCARERGAPELAGLSRGRGVSSGAEPANRDCLQAEIDLVDLPLDTFDVYQVASEAAVQAGNSIE